MYEETQESMRSTNLATHVNYVATRMMHENWWNFGTSESTARI